MRNPLRDLEKQGCGIDAPPLNCCVAICCCRADKAFKATPFLCWSADVAVN
jgi:hypothetical protein